MPPAGHRCCPCPSKPSPTHGLPLRLAWNSFLQCTRPSTRLASASRLASSADSTPAAAAQGGGGRLAGWEGGSALRPGGAGGCGLCLAPAASRQAQIKALIAAAAAAQNKPLAKLLVLPVNRPMKSSSLRPHISTASSADSWAATCTEGVGMHHAGVGRGCSSSSGKALGCNGEMRLVTRIAAAQLLQAAPTRRHPPTALTGSRNALFSVAGAAWHATVSRMRPNRRAACRGEAEGGQAERGSEPGTRGQLHCCYLQRPAILC